MRRSNSAPLWTLLTSAIAGGIVVLAQTAGEWPAFAGLIAFCVLAGGLRFLGTAGRRRRRPVAEEPAAALDPATRSPSHPAMQAFGATPEGPLERILRREPREPR